MIAVLFARADSVYKSLPDCDVWDADRNALLWPGGCPVNQCWWGHPAEKPSLFYVCRVRPQDVPAVTVQLAAPSRTVGSSRIELGGTLRTWRPEVSKRVREATPPALARWLVELAGRVAPAAIDQHGSARSTAAVPDRHGGGRPDLDGSASPCPPAGDHGLPAALAGHDHPGGRL